MGWFSKVGSFVKNNIHGILDVAGMIPGVGAVADLANAAIYAAEGDWGNAALSAVSAVPGVGDTIAMANKGLKVAKGVKTAIKGGKSLKGILKVGGKSILKAIKGKAKVGAKFLKKLNPKALFGKLKNGFKKVFLEAKCFTGDTLVYTEKGMQPIQEVKVGDLIYARNEETGEIGLKRVERTSETEAHTIYSITIDNKEVIRTTAYHGFYTEELEWVNSINLKVGDRLVSEEGIKSVTEIEKTRYDEPVNVYNFVVEDWHTYFVGEEKICVHNSVRHIINKVKDKVKDAYTKVKDTIKKVIKKGDPVDMVTGAVFNENIDFELPGVIPLKWERRYYSDSTREGILGHKTFLNYGTKIIISKKGDEFILLMPDGRAVQFDNDFSEGEIYNRIEKITINKIQNHFEVFFHEQMLYYIYKNTDMNLGTYKLKVIRNEAGNEIKFLYGDINLENIIDSSGRKIDIVSDKTNRITQVIFENKELVSYAYSQVGDLVSIKDALGQEKIIEYNNHLLIRMVTKDGFGFYWKYKDIYNSPKCIDTWGDNGVLEYHFEYGDGVTYSTNSLGYREAIYYNNSNLITKYIDAEGNITEYEYNDFEEIVCIKNALGKKEYFLYDKKGNVIEYIDYSGEKSNFVYDKKGRKVKEVYPNGAEKEWNFDKKGNIDKIINPNQSEIIFNFNKENLITEIEDSLNNKTKIHYDNWGNVNKIIQPDGSQTLYEYDIFGNCIKIINSLGVQQSFLYDDLNRVIRVEMEDGNIVHMKYNAYDKVVMARDNLHKVEFEYNWCGKVKKRKEKNRIINYIYNTEGQLQSLINEKGDKYTFRYDGNGNVIEEIGFDELRHGFIYDKLGHTIKIEEPDGKQKTFKYDANGNPIEIGYNDGSKDLFKYDKMGNLILAENKNSCIVFELDIMGNVLKTIQDGHVIEYEYNSMGQRTKLKSSFGLNINQNYNSQGNLSMINATLPNTSPWSSEIIYNSMGQETSRSITEEINSKWKYDKIGRPLMQSIGDTNRKYVRNYKWDLNGRLQSIIHAGIKINYDYDEYGYLKSSLFDSEEIFRNLDYFSNIYKTKEQKERLYGKAGQVLKSDTSQYIYDAQGNLIKKITEEGCWEYIYYDSGFMSKVIRPDGNVVEFKYDSLGRRIEKVFKGQIKKFLWDGDVLLHEWQEKNNTNDNIITWIFQEDSFVPIAKITQDENYGIVSDHLGTPIEMYSQKGKRVWNSILDIYGCVKKQEVNKESCPFRFQGQYEDEETGLYYNRFRYYSPTDGVYLQQDPIRVNGGWNLYAYVYDTTQLTDPLGLAPPNNGNARQHGSTSHNKFIDDLIDEIKKNTNGGAKNIRKNQQQHNSSGGKVGNNRPDIQFDYKGQHYNVEVDTTQRGSRGHQKTIPRNDPNARNTYWTIDKNGNITGGHSQVPQSSGPATHSTPSHPG